MHFLHAGKEDAKKINDIVENGNHVFLFVHMDGCGHCEAMKPAWQKLKSVLSDHYKERDNVYVIDVEQSNLDGVRHVGKMEGFPSLKYIHGNNVEDYESDSNKIGEKDRSTDSFIRWIESKIVDSKWSLKGGRRRGHKSRSKSRKSKSRKTKSRRPKSKSRRVRSRR